MLSKNQLADQLALQQALNSTVNPEWLTANYAWHRAIMVEAVEALDHFGWKWWKKSEPDVAQVRIELVDIWHFVLSATLVGTNGRIPDAVESLVGRFEASFNYDRADTRHLFDLLAAAAGEGYFNPGVFETLMRRMEFSWDQLHTMYVAKNVLNIFRQAHGYKDGTYIKLWHGKEDNVVLADLLAARPDATVEQLNDKLEAIYQPLTTGGAA